MIFHKFDLFILKKIIESYNKGKLIGTGNIAREWWVKPKSFESKREEDDYWKEKYDKVGKRLNAMSKDNLVLVSKSKGRKEYTLILDNVRIKRVTFPDRSSGKMIFVRENGGDWKAFEI